MIEITVQWLVNELRKAQRDAHWADIRDSDEPWLDVRLQASESDGRLHVGDAQFDTDHSGFWGSSSICEHDDYDTLCDVARDLIDQVMEDAYV